jgi:hypothetical protein
VARAIEDTYWGARSVSLVAAGQAVRAAVEDPARAAALAAQADPNEPPWQAAVFRDIVGNPFRPAVFAPEWGRWHGGLAVVMARRMYESRDFTHLPVLADVLEDAGCNSEPLLAHCRGPGPHTRGCFVIDLILSNDR